VIDDEMPSAAPGAAAAPRRHVTFIVALVFAVSVLKGVRMPNLWAATHMTFNYTHGFIRRGLFGQILRTIGGRRVYQYNILALCAAALFVLLAIVMIRFVRRTLHTGADDVGLQAAVLAIASSPAVVFLAHEIGYFDYLGLLGTLPFILWSARSTRLYRMFYVAVPISVVLALIHESMIIMFAPTMLFAMICHIATCARGGRLPRRTRLALIAHAALATAAAFAASSLVSAVGTRPEAVTNALQASIARTANFPLRGDAFIALYRPITYNLFTLMPWHWGHPANRTFLITGLVAAFPGLAFFGYYGVRLIGRVDLGRAGRAILIAAFVGAMLAPLALNFVGWDAPRWNAISLIDAFLCVAALRLFFTARMPDGRRYRLDDPLTLSLAALAIVAGLCTNYLNFLFDGYAIQWFPFDGLLDGAVELLKGHFTFIPRS
jgi:hypothetical protein